ncbi:hypothetical protein Tco_1238809 [Tanacetum coccineum]
MEATLSRFITPLKSLLGSFSVMNGALDYLAKELSIVENIVLQDGLLAQFLPVPLCAEVIGLNMLFDPFASFSSFASEAAEPL